ncbi:TIGR02391 family protein [Cellulomonas sp. GbtcB1]|uniref:TIGR02391 family protein n=1 Tax=Cellulomonas sp. GbtcB1 TaxID=2824746 RepID=UPI001C306436|nr:TIGR02391 family protein [Cellulomonas sp. GbtcB1]
MDPKNSVDYLTYLQSQLDAFSSLFEEFMTMHVESSGFGGRGIMPAVFPADGVDADEIAAVTRKLDRTVGTLMELANITEVRINVQGIGPVDPFVNWNTIRQPKPVLEPVNVRSCVDQAAGRLEALLRRAQALESPALSPIQLHPLVWAPAQRLWNDGHFRPAVAAAAEAVNSQMKQLTGRNDAPDTSLWQQAFTKTDPEPGKPRLRWPGAPDDRDVTTMLDGLRQFAPGTNMVIRNPATHEQTELSEQVALEYLATLSVLARLLEQCEVHTVTPS